MLHDLLASIIRTVVPMAVGALISWGVLPASLNEPATLFLAALISGTYYILVRVLETRWPWLGKLLGVPKAPTYG